jgi:hypothetical protein
VCIRLIINEFLPKIKGFEYKSNVEFMISQQAETTKGINHNFDPITMEDKPENVLVNICCSVKNLRRHLVYDQTSRKQADTARKI